MQVLKSETKKEMQEEHSQLGSLCGEKSVNVLD